MLYLYQALAVGVQESEIPCTSEPLRQNMLHKQPQERLSRDGPELYLPGFAVLITEGHLAICTGNNILFLNHATIEVATDENQDSVNGYAAPQSRRVSLAVVYHFG